MNRTKAIVAGVVGLVILCGVALFLSSRTSETDRTHVTISQAFQHLLYIGLYVAEDGGFFDKQGLDVSISTAGGDAQAFAALTSGQADFAQGDPSFVAIGAEKGWAGKVISMPVNRAAVWGVTLRQDITPFTDASGFRGYSVATYPQPNTAYVIQKELVERTGMKVGTDTKIVQVQFGSEIAALKSGQVDIAQTIEPNVTQLEKQGGKVVFSYPEAYGPLAFTGLMVSQAFIDKHPDVVQRVVNAYEEALRLIQTDRAKAVEIAAGRLPNLDHQTIETALDRLLNSQSIPQHTTVDLESFTKLLKIRASVGDIRSAPAASFIDNRFASEARLYVSKK